MSRLPNPVMPLLFLAAVGASAATAGQAEPPAWFLDHIEFMAGDGGRWITENFAYRSDAEPYDGYALEWRPGPGGKSLQGRLVALQGEREVGSPWEYRAFWHPGERRVLAYQFGSDGSLGTGVMEPTAAGGIRIEQTFFLVDGTRSGLGHESTPAAQDGDLIVVSYDLGPEGTWVERRRYTWRRRGGASTPPGE